MHRLWPLALLVLGAACARPLQAHTTQPNPLKFPTTDRKSERLVIHTKDFELPRHFLLRQSAYFKIVSRDRLRFHVRVTHKWEEYANIAGWDVRLEDDRGRVFRPEAKEVRARRHLTRVWDKERQTAQWDIFGDVKKTNNDGHKERRTMESVDAYAGTGDFAFFAEDLFTREVRTLTLVMTRGGTEMRFTWRFSEDPSQWTVFRAGQQPSGDYEDDFETAFVCVDAEGRPMPFGGGCVEGHDSGRGR